MNEINKLYAKAKIKQCKRDKGFTLKDCTDRDCNLCGFYVKPQFTAEKQIELIKWLSSKYGIYLVDKYSIGAGTCIGEFCTKENFEEALAGFINTLWQDLTEEEKEQVKGVLEA